LSQIYLLEKNIFFSIRPIEVVMGIHFNHKSKAGDRKMQKELKLKMKAEERKKKREEQERLKQEEEMKKLEELTRPDKTAE
tara:strand:- start:841 stop:1083 length:243 start_codon:yes stop_codon:yes gene_type:complete